MKMRKIFLFFLTSILSLQICLGQDTEFNQSEKNWLANYNIYSAEFLFPRFDRYSKEDIERFREKLDLFEKTESKDEWSGIFYFGSEETVNHSELRINSNIGFVCFNVYTCLPELRYIDYGKIVNTAEYIQLLPEFAENSPRKSEAAKYVKVKWGDKFLLVEESALPIFAEKAVGIFLEPNDDSSENKYKWTDFWLKSGLDSENHHQVQNKYVGLPEFPTNYKKFQRSPIEAKIIFVGKRTVEKADVVGNENGEFMEAGYNVTINAGKNKGVKVGMTFDIDEIDENFVITQVNQNNAVGKITRGLDENKIEFCTDGDNNQIECPKIKTAMNVKTRIGDFWF
jgi:hypothetical protein